MLVRKHSLIQTSQRRPAFTLMEMLVVVAIIIVLAGVGGYYLLGQLGQSRESAAKAQIQILTKAVQSYMIDHNGTPPNSLQELLQRDEMGKGPYLDSQEVLLSPWGAPYQYDPSGRNNNGMKPDIFVKSQDGTRDIGNWTTK